MKQEGIITKSRECVKLDNTDKKLHISDVSDSSSTQMWKDIMKWIIIIFSWIAVLIFSLILLENKAMMLGGWLLITGLVMKLKGKHYEKWYWKSEQFFINHNGCK